MAVTTGSTSSKAFWAWMAVEVLVAGYYGYKVATAETHPWASRSESAKRRKPLRRKAK